MYRDLDNWVPAASAHCWVFEETLMENLRECLQVYEHSSPHHTGFVDWDIFNSFVPNATTVKKLKREKRSAGFSSFTDSSKSLEARSQRHGSCHKYNPTLQQAVRKTDPWMFENFGYTTCCGQRTKPMPESHVAAP